MVCECDHKKVRKGYTNQVGISPDDYTRAMRGPLDVGNAVLDQVAYSPTIIILQLFGSKVTLFRDFRGFWGVHCG